MRNHGTGRLWQLSRITQQMYSVVGNITINVCCPPHYLSSQMRQPGFSDPTVIPGTLQLFSVSFSHQQREKQSCCSPGGCMLLLLLFVGVAADSDDTHCGARGVGNDYRLPLPLPRGAGGHVAPAAGDGGAAGRAVVHHGTARRRVFLHSFRPLRRADGLRGWNFVGGCVSGNRKGR